MKRNGAFIFLIAALICGNPIFGEPALGDTLPSATGANGLPAEDIVRQRQANITQSQEQAKKAAAPAISNNEIYADPNYPNLLKAMIRLQGFDTNDDELVDAYALTDGCDLYNNYYKDEFAWNKVRNLYRQSWKINMDKFPLAFSFSSPVELDRYDFQTQIFRFTPGSELRSVAVIMLAGRPAGRCDNASDKLLGRLPSRLRVSILPMTIEGLNISPDQATDLLSYFKSQKENTRVVYARFRIRLDSAPPVSDLLKKSEHLGNYDFRGTVESVTFFADQNLQFPLWVYRRTYMSEQDKARQVQEILQLKVPPPQAATGAPGSAPSSDTSTFEIGPDSVPVPNGGAVKPAAQSPPK